MKLKQIGMEVGRAFSDALFDFMVDRGMILSVLPLKVDKEGFTKIPEGQRTLYVEKDGGYQLDVDGLEDTSGLKSALAAERTRASSEEKTRKEQERLRREMEEKYKGIDPEKVRALMGQFEDAEEAELIKSGKAGIDKILEKRLSKAKEQWEKDLKEARESGEGALEVAATFMEEALDNRIRSASEKAGVHQHAIDDVLLRGRTLFALDDDRRAVQFEEDGETIVLGKDGKTPFSPEEWLEGMKDKAPHWWPAGTSGGGSGGGKGGRPGQRTMKRASFEAMAPQEQREFTVTQKGTVID